MSKCKVFNLTLEGLTKGQVEGRVIFYKDDNDVIKLAGLDIETKTGQKFDTLETRFIRFDDESRGKDVFQNELLPLLQEELGDRVTNSPRLSYDHYEGFGYMAVYSERTQDGDTEFHLAIKFNNGEVRYLIVAIPWFAFESTAVNSLFVPGHLLVKSA